jgi:hypothetical protein
LTKGLRSFAGLHGAQDSAAHDGLSTVRCYLVLVLVLVAHTVCHWARVVFQGAFVGREAYGWLEVGAICALSELDVH